MIQNEHLRKLTIHVFDVCFVRPVSELFRELTKCYANLRFTFWQFPTIYGNLRMFTITYGISLGFDVTKLRIAASQSKQTCACMCLLISVADRQIPIKQVLLWILPRPAHWSHGEPTRTAQEQRCTHTSAAVYQRTCPWSVTVWSVMSKLDLPKLDLSKLDLWCRSLICQRTTRNSKRK